MVAQDTLFHRKRSLNCRGRIVDLSEAKVMGILNVTPDSFFDGGDHDTTEQAVVHGLKLSNEGATFIDIGGQSSRPGSKEVTADVELNRTIPVIEGLLKADPKMLISIDTYRSEVAIAAVESGAVMINDISGGLLDEKMFDAASVLKVPYVCMHMQGEPSVMQNSPQYDHVVYEVTKYFSEQIEAMREAGIIDIILDPGFGFGKTMKHNYQLLQHLDHLEILGCPILVGLSRKSMIYKKLKISPVDSLNGTSSLHSICLERGASILRAHDVKEALECITLMEELKRNTLHV